MRLSVNFLKIILPFLVLSCNGPISNEKEGFDQRNTSNKSQAFDAILNSGVYFKNGHGMGVLFTSDALFLIAYDSIDLQQRSFAHFLRDDGSFANNSFSHKKYTYQNKLNLRNKNIKIARVEIENIEEFSKIRIGQYNQSGNIWSQVFVIEEVLKNPLLRYDFENNTDLDYEIAPKENN